MIFGILGVLLIVVLILPIIQMVRGTQSLITVVHSDDRQIAPPRLPDRTTEEVEALIESMPSKWVFYEGMTPPLKLKVRYQTYENFRRFSRKYIDGIGQHNFERLSQEQQQDLLLHIAADAYVCDWEGAHYPNGNPLPYTPANLFSLMTSDPLLINFITEQSHKLGPPWRFPAARSA